MTEQRIGIYAGSFNPVHSGHIAFALQALQTAKLDRLYFLPERQPRYKPGVEHMGHRVAMLDRALLPHPKLAVLELPDVNFNVQRTLARLRRFHPTDQLVFLFGSEVIPTLPEWPYIDQLLPNAELVVGLRVHDTKPELLQAVAGWPVQPKKLTVIQSYAPTVSSTSIRQALRERRKVNGLLSSVARYSDRHWLYVSLA